MTTPANFADAEGKSDYLANHPEPDQPTADEVEQWVNCPQGHTSPWYCVECEKCGWVLCPRCNPIDKRRSA